MLHNRFLEIKKMYMLFIKTKLYLFIFCFWHSVNSAAFNCIPVDGIWEVWEEWSECNVSCAGGQIVRSRECDGPYFGGLACDGSQLDYQPCNEHVCPGIIIMIFFST